MQDKCKGYHSSLKPCYSEEASRVRLDKQCHRISRGLDPRDREALSKPVSFIEPNFSGKRFGLRARIALDSVSERQFRKPLKQGGSTVLQKGQEVR